MWKECHDFGCSKLQIYLLFPSFHQHVMCIVDITLQSWDILCIYKFRVTILFYLTALSQFHRLYRVERKDMNNKLGRMWKEVTGLYLDAAQVLTGRD